MQFIATKREGRAPSYRYVVNRKVEMEDFFGDVEEVEIAVDQ